LVSGAGAGWSLHTSLIDQHQFLQTNGKIKNHALFSLSLLRIPLASLFTHDEAGNMKYLNSLIAGRKSKGCEEKCKLLVLEFKWRNGYNELTNFNPNWFNNIEKAHPSSNGDAMSQRSVRLICIVDRSPDCRRLPFGSFCFFERRPFGSVKSL
jgi:hypothetical protein